VCLHPSAQPRGPSFMHLWSSVCLFLHLPSPSVRFLGQAHAGCELIESGSFRSLTNVKNFNCFVMFAKMPYSS
jgi:hypothetical protein